MQHSMNVFTKVSAIMQQSIMVILIKKIKAMIKIFKNNKRSVLIMLAALFILSSFKLKERNDSIVQPAIGVFSATLNDSIQKSWSTCHYDTLEGNIGINIYALNGNEVALKIYINASVPGTYDVNGRTCSINYYLSAEEKRSAINGNVIITQNENNTLSGTFTFDDGLMENGITFTNGVFTDVPLQ